MYKPTRICSGLAAATIVALLAARCSSALGDPRDRLVSDFTPQYPKNYLIVHSGARTGFFSAKCYELTANDEDSKIDVAIYLRSLIRERLPMLSPCRGELPKLIIDYRAGYGACIDCGTTAADPRSAFAFVQLVTQQSDAALAEWQYWRGGSPTAVAQQFIFDFINLYINALEKPIPK